MERAARDYDIVLLIDGVFHHDLAPSPKECYEATRHAQMFGAASMGALRAAECAPYGFTPIGAIARWYVREVIDGDDEVAVLAHPARHEALSIPLVNVRYVAQLARRRTILTQHEASDLVARSREVFYMDRTWDDVVNAAPERARAALIGLIGEESDLKRLDARFALRRALRAQGEGAPQRSIVVPGSWPQQAATSPISLPPRVPKVAGTYDRAIAFEESLKRVPLLREHYGITRVADTTFLDRTGIPTFSAMVPHSPDLLGVYNGKGMSRDAAMASAVMEATERQIGARVALPVFRESLRAVGERIDLEACGMRTGVRDDVVDCVLGTDLLRGDAVAVPLAMVQCPWCGPALFDTTSTNGLASGNNVTEAIYHALCELVERHAWAIYHTRCSLAPRMFLGKDACDVPLAPAVTFPCGDPVVDALVESIEEAGLTVRALLLREHPLPWTFAATVVEPESDPPMAHFGLGCSLSPAHAITRALTEAVQSRVVDIQAAREDILRVGEPAGILGDHGRRSGTLPQAQWYYDAALSNVDFQSISDLSSDDLALDVQRTLDALRRYGISSAIAVDISHDGMPISVVRAVAPELETFMFTGHVGARIRAELNPFAVRELIS
ncbi:MAG TPA: YcaO-like family protein [Candidatus Aquilonibacter sp.]